MTIYILIFSLFLFLTIFSKNIKKDKKSAILSIVIMILLAGFRYRVGSDALLYQDIYEQYPTLSQLNRIYIETSRWNPLFVMWYSFCHTLFYEFVYYQFIHAFIFLLVIYLTIKRYSKLMMPAILLFYIISYTYMVFDLYREALAAAIFLIAIPFLERRNYILYYVFCFICFNIHTSAFVSFFVPLLYKFRFTDYGWKPVIICILLSFVVPFFILKICSLIPVESIRSLAMIYLNRNINMSGIDLFRIVYVIVAYYFAIHKNLYCINDKNVLMFNMAYFSLILECFQDSIPFIFRFNSYFKIFLIIALGLFVTRMLYEYRKKHNIKKICVAFFVLIIFCGPRLLDYVKNEGTYNAYFPYVSIFNPRTIIAREFHSVNDYLNYDR